MLNLGCMNADMFSYILSEFRLIPCCVTTENLHKTETNSWQERSAHMYSPEASADSLTGAAFSFLAFCAAGVATAVHSQL